MATCQSQPFLIISLICRERLGFRFYFKVRGALRGPFLDMYREPLAWALGSISNCEGPRGAHPSIYTAVGEGAIRIRAIFDGRCAAFPG